MQLSSEEVSIVLAEVGVAGVGVVEVGIAEVGVAEVGVAEVGGDILIVIIILASEIIQYSWLAVVIDTCIAIIGIYIAIYNYLYIVIIAIYR